MVNLITKRFDCVLFDLGNTLIAQENPGTPYESLVVKVLPGVVELLDQLHGKVKIGIVSNTQTITSADIQAKLSTVGLDKYFQTIIATAEFGAHKPNPEPIIAAVEQLQCVADRTLYVGDIETDKQAALSAGAHFAYAGPNLYESVRQYLLHNQSAFARAINTRPVFSKEHNNAVRKEFDGLAKPVGSLGRLEHLAALIAGITHSQNPTVDPAAIALFGADHGIAFDNSVTPWPQAITAQMLEVMGENKAAVSVLAGVADVYVEIVNVGAIVDSKSPNVRNERVATGTQDIRVTHAMSETVVRAALEVGAQTAERLIAGGSRCLVTGEVGIGNTTPSAALIAHFTQTTAEQVTGRGSGIDDETFIRKIEVVANLIARTKNEEDPITVLTDIGGIEIAALAGYILRAASLQIPVVLDGVITLAAATVAHAINSEVNQFLIAGHASSEPASRIAIMHLQLQPILDLELRLGEGTGALLSIPIMRAACQALSRMARISNLTK
jgi:nicotinate-nucleotide--dimethylbenzimidazole phosphoribosyltransferase